MQQQDARYRQENEERKRRETEAEERRRSQKQQAEEGGGEDGEQGDARESEPPADNRRTAEDYKLSKKRSGRGERKGEAKRNEKRLTDWKNIETSKDRERKGRQKEAKN